MDSPDQKHPPRSRRALIRRSATAIVVVAGLALGVVVLIPHRSSAGSLGTSADIAPVSRTSFDIATAASGELQARNQIEIRSELDGESSILEIIPEGGRVKTGDLLVRLSGEDIQLKIDEVLPRTETARADAVAADKGVEIQTSENDSKVRQAKLKLDLAQLALDQWDKGERVQKEKDLELGLDKTEKDLARLEEKYTQSESLFKEGFLSKNDLQLDEIALRDAKAARAKAELDDATYRNYQRPKDERTKRSDVEEAKAELEREQKQAAMQLDIKTAEATAKKEQLKICERQLEKLQKQLASCTVKAPQDGLVVYGTSAGRNWFDDSPLTVGRKVHPQEVMIVLPDTSEMLAVVKVHESLAGKVQPGQRALVKIEAVGNRTFEGKVDSIGVMAETSDRWRDPNKREYTIKIALVDTQSEVPLKPSMRCEASITLGRVDDAIAVPVQSVFSDDALKFVYAAGAGRYTKTPVKIGRRSETLAEVTVGLSAGDRVLLREPSPGEVIGRPWDETQLKDVGFALKDGKPIALASEIPKVATPPVAPAPTPPNKTQAVVTTAEEVKPAGG